jgi:hypothetical protein
LRQLQRNKNRPLAVIRPPRSSLSRRRARAGSLRNGLVRKCRNSKNRSGRVRLALDQQPDNRVTHRLTSRTSESGAEMHVIRDGIKRRRCASALAKIEAEHLKRQLPVNRRNAAISQVRLRAAARPGRVTRREIGSRIPSKITRGQTLHGYQISNERVSPPVSRTILNA